jgi:hypothetical protein
MGALVPEDPSVPVAKEGMLLTLNMDANPGPDGPPVNVNMTTTISTNSQVTPIK